MTSSVQLPKCDSQTSPAAMSSLSDTQSKSADVGALPPEPIAIVGLSLRFPQEATSPQNFWEMLLKQRCASSEWPPDRLNLNSFYHPDKNRNDALAMRGGHFVQEDLGLFDAPFFSITASEAMCMDPQHRIMLETTYRALENAGMGLEKVAGSQTGVYTGAFADDFKLQTLRDIETLPKHAITGEALSLLANRISWFFNLTGPSMNIDTACSSSMVALDLACQGLRSRNSRMALVAGSNLVFGLENMLTMSNMNFFSKDSKCFSFDHRANGYSRGEGFGVLVIKRLCDAIADNDTIRAVIRSTGSNQDGRTPGITQPSGAAQAALIRQTYAKANLDLNQTRFFEAHGTGTAIGDPTEANAIGDVFRSVRSPEDPLYIGAVKSNIGHLEGSSGIAGIIKTVLILEKGLIPPNANFEKLNPRINAAALNLQFPHKAIPWPSPGLRRASVNAFGFGGSNSHVVLDDAYNYLRLHGLNGKHNTVCPPPLPGSVVNDARQPLDEVPARTALATQTPKLLVWSAADEKGIERLSKIYGQYLKDSLLAGSSKRGMSNFFENLAYTLALRRSSFSWKAFAVTSDNFTIVGQDLSLSRATRSLNNLGLAFVFTGQGAQYAEMGRELMAYEVFRGSFDAAEQAMRNLGSSWSLTEELFKPADASRVNEPGLSQPLCTALQIALVDLLQAFGLSPVAVVGHSSGEIAAAYSIGALSLSSACKLAYFRGQLANTLVGGTGSYQGAMLSVGLSESAAKQYIQRLDPTSILLTVGCVNCYNNVTVSGDRDAVNALKALLESEDVFTRKLVVDVAYHSPQMGQIASAYREAIQGLEPGLAPTSPAIMYSSITGKTVAPKDLLNGEYWVENMLSQVRFSDATSQLLAKPANTRKKLGAVRNPSVPSVHHVLEIGPHSALRAPFRAILEDLGRSKDITYTSLLMRKSSALTTTVQAMGFLYCLGYPVRLDRINHPAKSLDELQALTDLPEYPFDHSQKYWAESRISKSLRLRKQPRLDLLGTQVPDWNPLECRWRKIIRISETPWVEDHKVNGAIIFPAAAMFVMAIEAAKQTARADQEIEGYLIEDATFHHAVNVPFEGDDLELQMYLRPVNDATDKHSAWSEYRVCAYENNQWVENCKGSIKVQYKENQGDDSNNTQGSTAKARETQFQEEKYQQLWKDKQITCNEPISSAAMYEHFLKIGMGYGPAFQALKNVKFNKHGEATAEVMTFDWADVGDAPHHQDHVIHPVTLDAAAQLIFLALTEGGTKTMPTSIPTRVRNLWVSGTGLSCPNTKSIKAYTKSITKSHRTTDSSLFALDSETNQLKMMITSLETTTVASQASDPTAQIDSMQLCMEVVLKPDVDFLSVSETAKLSESHVVGSVEPVDYYGDLSFVIFTHILKALEQLKCMKLNALPSHLTRYVAWMDKQIEAYSKRTLPCFQPWWELQSKNPDYVDAAIQRVANQGAEGRLFTQVGAQLVNVLQSKTDVLNLLFEGQLAKDYYADIFSSSHCCQSVATYVDLLAHKKSDMNILEIGAGTGGMTRQILSALQTPQAGQELARFAKYDYTDISSAFFEKAEADLRPLMSQKVRFKTLNIENDPGTQGFDPGSYDLVIAGLALHATHNLNATVQNVRKLLKPGGKALIFEIVQPDIMRTGFVFGLLPGWWLGTEHSRQWTPCVSESEWSLTLGRNGFSGVDMMFKDYQDPSCHEMGLIVSTAVSDVEPAKDERPIPMSIIIDTSSLAQMQFAHRMMATLKLFAECSIISLREAALLSEQMKDSCLIYLLELEQPFLYDISQTCFDRLKQSLVGASSILWITRNESTASSSPKYGMIDGLTRVLRSENNLLKCVTLALDRSPNDDQATADERYMAHVSRILQQMSSRDVSDLEPEYVEVDGRLHINRVVPARTLNETVHKYEKVQQEMKAFGTGPGLAMKVANPGMLDSLVFVEDDEALSTPLAPREVEVKVEAVGVNYMDTLTVLGRVSKNTVGGECAGTITRVGSAIHGHEFKPGDRVCAAILDCFRSYARSDAILVTKIPDDISFRDASSIPVTGVTTHYSLIEFARVQPGESVLIHSAAGGIGQLAIQISQSLGATIYVTVGTSEKKQLLMERYGIPEAHILSSRNSSFADGIMRLTSGKGVDVILNSLSGELLRASWDCIASFGRFVEIGKKDIHAHNKLPMFPFHKNVSFGAVDLDHMHIERPEIFQRSLHAVVKMLSDGKLNVAYPLHTYPPSGIESALRFMQSGKHMGKIVVDFQADATHAQVQTLLKPKPSYEFDANASFIIVGGFGGLGQSIARWLTRRGARYLILLSRSGPKTDAATSLVTELRASGVRVECPICDVTNYEALSQTLSDLYNNGIPPVKGCIQGAMVLRDALFSNMSFDEWASAVSPKSHGSWNLHRLLPGLSFFVMLSSISGAIGNPGQANYAAGNTYQDALARHRIACGLPAVALDLGWLASIGAVAESDRLRKGVSSRSYLLPISEADLLALLEFFCDPKHSGQPTVPRTDASITASRFLIGLANPSQTSSPSTDLPAFYRTPPYQPLFQVGASNTTTASGGASTTDYAALFAACQSLADAGEVVTTGLARKLAAALGGVAGDIDTEKPLHVYGVDSLLAVELRNWFAKEFGADVAIFDIMGGQSIAQVGVAVALKARWRKAGWE